MKRAVKVKEKLDEIQTIDNVAQAFKGIASLHVSQVKDQVLASKNFFGELWHIYSQLRTSKDRQFSLAQVEKRDKGVAVLVTGEGSLSGDLDDKLVEWVLTKCDPSETDFIVLGRNGAVRLSRRDVAIKRYFAVPQGVKQQFNPQPIIEELIHYEEPKIYYQTYVTLTVQDIASMDLITTVQTLGESARGSGAVIAPDNYIFEPSLPEVIEHMESVMLGIALTQAVLETKLAQYASRFNAMSAAHDKAERKTRDLRLQYYRAKRTEDDERSREIINSLKQQQGSLI